MPPLLEWKCMTCKESTVEEVRSIDDTDRPPSGECPTCTKDTDWKRYLSKAPHAGYSRNWAGGGGGKGSW